MTTAEPSNEFFKNDEVSVVVHKKSGSRIEFEVTASLLLTKPAYVEAVHAVTKEVSLPGFRKGKAPAGLVEKKFDKQIDQSWQEKIALRALKQAELLTGIHPIDSKSKISFSMKKHNLEIGAELSLSFEVEPSVPHVHFDNLEIKRVERPVIDDAKVQEAIRQVHFFFASWTPVENRGVSEGDYVLLDVENLETTPPEKVFHATRFEVSKKGMAEWMLHLVLGKNIHESIEGISVADETASEEEKKNFTPKKVRITILSIEHANLPPIDAAFSKKLGVPENTTLEEQIARILNKQADVHVEDTLRNAVYEELVLKYPFELPYSLVEKEVQFRMRHIFSDPEFLEHWKHLGEEEQKRMLSSVFAQSQKALCLFYLCRKIVETAGISVDPKDLPEPPATPLENLMQAHSSTNASGEPEAFSSLLLKKAADHILANITLLAQEHST